MIMNGVDPATIAAIFSALATGFAAYATWQGPRSAAELAETMRQRSERANEKRRMKLFVFTTLMQERGAYYSTEAVKAFNLIDVVFNENRTVRDSWADFLNLMGRDNVPDHAKSEKFQKLLSNMASDVDLTDGLRIDDLNRYYYPTAMAQEEHVRILQRQAVLKQLQGNVSPSANVTEPQTVSSEFPPPPPKN
jgi:hypothetical protein